MQAFQSWIASATTLALVGAVLTGFVYSLVYPGFGVEAVRRAPPQSKAAVLPWAFTPHFSISHWNWPLGTPALGLVADKAGVAAIFLVSTLLVVGAAGTAWRLLNTAARPN